LYLCGAASGALFSKEIVRTLGKLLPQVREAAEVRRVIEKRIVHVDRRSIGTRQKLALK